jgi:putative transposase
VLQVGPVPWTDLDLAQSNMRGPWAPFPQDRRWSLVRGARANSAFGTPDDLDRTLRRELRRIQLRPLIDGCLTATDLTINPPTQL